MKALGLLLTAVFSAAAGAAAAYFAVKKHDEVEQYDYDFDDGEEIFFDDEEESQCDGCTEDCSECEFAESAEAEELSKLDGTEE